MNNRICTGCGWEFPPSYNELRCRFCGTPFKERFCATCGQLKVMCRPGSLMCKDCDNKREREGTRSERVHEYMERRVAAVDKRYKDWVSQVSAAPFKPLTEEQWLKTCRYFNGCALCNNIEIATRGYFVQYSEGGRYTAWNILPMCDLCATELKKQPNPFKRMDPRLNTSLAQCRGKDPEQLERVFKYLQERLKEYGK